MRSLYSVILESVLLCTFYLATDGLHDMNIPVLHYSCYIHLPFLLLSRLQPVRVSLSAIFAARQFLRSSWMDDGIIILHKL